MPEKADLIVALDSFEHFEDPEAILATMHTMLKPDGATRFNEVEGGLNQMTIRRFKKIVERSGFSIDTLEPVPIKKLKWLANPLTQEFTTSIVRCKLLPR